MLEALKKLKEKEGILSNSINNYKKEIDKIKGDVKAQQDIIPLISAEIANKEKKKEALNKELADINKKIAVANDLFLSADKKYKEAEKECGHLLSKTKKDLENSAKYIASVKNDEAEVKEIFQAKVKECEDFLDKTEIEIEKIIAKKDGEQGQVIDAQEKKKELIKDLENVNKSLVQEKRLYANLHKEIVNINIQNEELRKTLQDIKDKIKETTAKSQEELTKLNQAKKERQEEEKELDNLKKKRMAIKTAAERVKLIYNDAIDLYKEAGLDVPKIKLDFKDI